VDPSKRRQMTTASMSGLDGHIEMTGGRMFADQPAGGVIEAIVYEEAMFRNDFRVGDEFHYPITGASGIAPLKIKVVGTFVPQSDTDPFWYQGFESLLNTFLISGDVFQKEL